MHVHTHVLLVDTTLIVLKLSVFRSCRVVLVAAESSKKTQEQRACVISAEQPIVAAKHDMGTNCQVVLYGSAALSSALPPSGQEIIAAVLKARQDVSEQYVAANTDNV